MFQKEEEIFNIISEEDFGRVCLRVFQFQCENNQVYRKWINALKINVGNIINWRDIPFLPIEFFKKEKVVSSEVNSNTLVFKSSATTSQTPSSHYVINPDLYRTSFKKCFQIFYGDPSQYCILALLPGYLERKDSSLVYMVDDLVKASGNALSGFYLRNYSELISTIQILKERKQKTLLIGVSYALMDLSEMVKLDENFIVMETGGMKGMRKEMLKAELHDFLKNGFGIEQIHSEYGMTELLSQAYSGANGIFRYPPWMRFLIREVTDPLQLRGDQKTGGINVIDLANVYSCSFIATQDLGRISDNGLELMGRYDNSDIRGCNLMY